MARRLGSGAGHVMLGTALAKGATFITQIVLGWHLTEAQFGLFAIAVSISAFLMVFRDGGAFTILVQRGAAAYPSVSGPLFWMATTFLTLSAALVTVLAIPLAQHVYHAPDLPPLLYWYAASLPISAVGAVLQNKLRIDLRFAEVARIQLVSALLRQGSTIGFALAGFGAVSLAIPYVICYAYEAVASYRVTRDSPWRRPPVLASWPSYIREGKWVVFYVFSNALLDLGPYAVMGALVPKSITGVFYFAFQLTAQTGVLLSTGAQTVLFPAFARLNSEPERQRRAVVRAARAIMLSGTAACLALAVVVEPVEHILWRGKWQEAVWPVVILGLFYPWRITFGLTVSVLQGQGRFKRVALLTFAEGVGLVLAALAAAVLVPTPMGLALFAGVWLLLARVCITCFTLRTIGVGWIETLWSIFPAWVLGCIATGATLGLDHLLGPGPGIASALAGLMPASWAGLIAEFVRAGLLGLVAATLYAVGCRTLLADHLVDLLSVTPRRLARPAAAVLRLQLP